MKLIDGWTIQRIEGTGKGPEFRPVPCFIVVSPTVRTETRVDRDGLRDILPEHIYRAFQEPEPCGHIQQPRPATHFSKMESKWAEQ